MLYQQQERLNPTTSADFKLYIGGPKLPMSKYTKDVLLSAKLLLLQQQLKWPGHVIRMLSNCITCRVLYGVLVCQRSKGGQNKCFRDYIKACLKKCSIPFSQLETVVADQDSWKSTCEIGLTNFMAVQDQAAEDQRTRRHGVHDGQRTQLSYLYMMTRCTRHCVHDDTVYMTASGPSCPTCT